MEQECSQEHRKKDTKMHLPILLSVLGYLAGKLELARILLGSQAIRKARQQDVPAVTAELAKWQGPSWMKRN
jgi:hypothetical protein